MGGVGVDVVAVCHVHRFSFRREALLCSFSCGREFEQTGRLARHETGAAPEPAFGAVSSKAWNALVSLGSAKKRKGKIKIKTSQTSFSLTVT